MKIVPAIALWTFAYILLRPLLVSIDLSTAYRPLFFYDQYFPIDYFSNAAVLSLIALGFIIALNHTIGKQERLFWQGYIRPLVENSRSTLALFTAILSFLIVPFSGFYFALSYLLAYRVRRLILILFLLFITFFAATTEDRRHLAALLIFIFSTQFSNSASPTSKNANLLRLLKGSYLYILGFSLLSLLAYISIKMRSDISLKLISSRDYALRLIEIELDFPIIYDDLNFLLSEIKEKVILPDNLLHMVYKPFLTVIPRSIWSEKPESSSRVFAELYFQAFYNNGGSLPTTFIGDALLSFGIFCVFGLTYILAFIYFLKRFLHKTPEIFYSHLLITSFLFVRGPFDSFALTIIPIFIYWFFSNLTRRRAH
ncbi:hypothetical protein FIU97_19265 (plasmid) [Roseivivax sp. THAF40]|uniref:hypothetical protein n=1 Tax=Roseivivax sp. THAF40 TaxID=2587858 RepID=UPI0012A87FF4|nr:hypothetical protein [Roseivivax sp. THAF40]QFT48735.1 hypothetical protein FIU97_19265 [Roseivivax sp. THAF40]